MSNLGPTDLKRLHRDWRRRTTHRLAIGLDGVAGPFNVGGIIRTAAAYRAERLWLTASSTGPEHTKVGRTAMGTDRYLTVLRVDSGAAIVDAARAEGYLVVAVELSSDARPMHTLDLRRDVCLLFGHEDHGVSRAALLGADAVGYLPQLGKVGSLNVATAAGMAVYEWARQQWTAPGEHPAE